jgi:hypothetical protein
VSANATYSLNGALLIDDAAYKRGYRDQAGVDYIFE